MPQAIPLVLAGAVASAGLTGLPLILANLAVAALSNVLLKKNEDTSYVAKSISTMSRDGIKPRTIVYGEAQLSGPIVYAGGNGYPYGGPSAGLSVLVALTGHPLEEIVSVSLGADVFYFDTGVADNNWAIEAKFKNNTRLFAMTGQETYSPHAVAFTNAVGYPWKAYNTTATTNTNRLDSVGYVGYIINRIDDVWNNIPNLKAHVKGKRVRSSQAMYTLQQAAQDPMTAPEAYSNNWADCVLDYLMEPYLGLGIPIEEIDLLYFNNAAILSDEFITVPGTNPVYQGKRYTCDGVVSCGNTPMSNLEGLLSAGFGTLAYTQGKYRIYGGEYIPPLVATEDVLTESDLAGPIKIRVTVPRNERFNAVRGTYLQKGRELDARSSRFNTKLFTVTDFPEVANATYKAADSGSDNYTDVALDGYIYRDLELPFTNNEHTAQRIANIALNTARQAILLEAEVKVKAIRYSVGDNIKVNFPSLALGQETNVNFQAAVFGVPLLAGGTITSIPIVSGGSGYNYPPSLLITTDAGADAIMFAVLDQGTIVEIIIVSGGTGYTIADTIVAEDPTLLSLQWSDKVFKIQTWAPTSRGTINLTLQEDTASSYADYISISSDSAPDVGVVTSLDAYTPSNLVLDSGVEGAGTSIDGTWVPSLVATFSPGLDPVVVSHYTVEMSKGSVVSSDLSIVSVDATVEDPVSSGEYTATVNFTLAEDPTLVVPYALTSADAEGEFNMVNNIGTLASPVYVDEKSNYGNLTVLFI